MLPLVALALPLTPVENCPSQQIVAAAHVRSVNRSTWPDYPRGPIPDAATVAQRRSASFAAMHIKPLTEGLDLINSTDVDWPVKGCSVSLIGGGNNGLLSDGRVIRLDGGTAIAVGTATERPPVPAGPIIKNAKFIASTAISVEDWLVGVWCFRDGHSIIAAYRPGDTVPKFPVLESAKPVIGISYLGAPDTFGGNLTILQRIGRNSYRWSSVGWSEKAVRAGKIS